MSELPDLAPSDAARPVKPRKPTREEVALIEVGHTDISPATARLLVAAFLALILVVPLVDSVLQFRRGGLAEVRCLDLVRTPPSLAMFTFPVHRVATEEHNPFHAFEADVENASSIRLACQTRLQALFTGVLHGGNSRVVRGEGDWLFFRDGVDYVTAPGFLDGSWHQIRRRLQPDPRPAVLAFARNCAAAGARLVLLPVPDKAQIHPGRISSRYRDGEALENPDFARFVTEMRAAGIAVVESAPLLRARAAAGDAYLHQDSHWLPQSMDAVAALVASQLDLPAPAALRGWRESERQVSRLGDLVGTLKLPEGHGLFTPAEVAIRPVVDDAGRPFAPNADADVLLLGDSFTNIYGDRPGQQERDGALGWGESAGFAARLAFHLQRDLDVIAINGQGATGVRRELAKRKLGAVTVVVWQFSARDLAVTSWDIIPVGRRPAAAAQPAGLAAAPVELTVQLAITSTVMPPGSVPYTEALTTVKGKVVAVVGGAYTQSEVLLVASCMEANKLTDFARLRPGDTIRVRLLPWDAVAAKQGTKNTYDETEEIDLPRWWVEGWSRP